MRLTLTAAAIALGTACLPPGSGTETAAPIETGTSAPRDVTAELTDASGCADTSIAVRRADDALALFVFAEGLAAEAHAAEGPVTTTWSLPDPAVTSRIDGGENVTHHHCNDALWLEVVVDHTWEPAEGTLTLTVTPTGEPQPWGEVPADAELQLDGARFVDPTGAEPDLLIDGMRFTIAVGWLPG
jgi:hypothetical protein